MTKNFNEIIFLCKFTYLTDNNSPLKTNIFAKRDLIRRDTIQMKKKRKKIEKHQSSTHNDILIPTENILSSWTKEAKLIGVSMKVPSPPSRYSLNDRAERKRPSVGLSLKIISAVDHCVHLPGEKQVNL